jgi:hypothetical protein
VKKTFSAFVLTNTLTLDNLSDVASEYINVETNIIKIISDEIYIRTINKNKLEQMIQAIESSSIEFESKFVNYIYNNIQNLVKEEKSTIVGSSLALVAKYLFDKEDSLANIQKIFKKDRLLISLNKYIIIMMKNNKELQNKIQELIEVSHIGIEAKSLISFLNFETKKIDKDFKIDDYWYDFNFNKKDNVLYMSSKFVSNLEDINKVYELEKLVNTKYNNYIIANKVYFYRISFI